MRRLSTTVALLFCLLTSVGSASAEELCSKQIFVRKNGDVIIDGKLYSTRTALKERIAELKQRTPDCWASLTSEKGTEVKTIDQIVAIVRQAGISQVGFLTEPNNP